MPCPTWIDDPREWTGVTCDYDGCQCDYCTGRARRVHLGYSTTAVPDCPYQCGGIGGHAYGCPVVSIDDPWFDGYQEAS